jgi:hypothetical protein
VVTGEDPCDIVININHFLDLTEQEFRKNYLITPEFFDEAKYKPENTIFDLLFQDKNDKEKQEIKAILENKDFDIFL